MTGVEPSKKHCVTSGGKLKRENQTRDVESIANSRIEKGEKEKALEAGCAGYIAKPIDTRKFLETVSQFFR